MIAINENDIVQQTRMVSSYVFFSFRPASALSSFYNQREQVYTPTLNTLSGKAHNILKLYGSFHFV